MQPHPPYDHFNIKLGIFYFGELKMMNVDVESVSRGSSGYLKVDGVLCSEEFTDCGPILGRFKSNPGPDSIVMTLWWSEGDAKWRIATPNIEDGILFESVSMRHVTLASANGKLGFKGDLQIRGQEAHVMGAQL